MKRVELLSPAGDLEKLKIAYLYGADACYIGGKEFSLRANANNFSLDEIKQAVDYAHKLNKKLYVTTNIVFHNDHELKINVDAKKESPRLWILSTINPSIRYLRIQT